MAELDDLNIVDGDNTARQPEGVAAGQVNDGVRALEGLLARGFKDAVEGDRDSTGSANAYLVAANRTISAYYDGMRVGFHASFANTASATLDIDSVAAKTIKKNHDVDLASGDIEINQYVEVVYSATDDTFQMLSPLAREIADGIYVKNAIINGNFDIWQRGTSFSTPASGDYSADRMTVVYDGTIGTFTVSRQSFALGQTDVPGEPEFFWRWDHTVAGSGSAIRAFLQRIEDVRTFGAEQVTISFYAKADSARTVVSRLVQNFGTSGAPSARVGTAAQDNSLTTSWQRFTHTVTLASISGKTLGTDGDDHIELELVFPLNTTMTIDIGRIQVELGDIATSFERLPLVQELARCLRYTWVTGPINAAYVFGAGQCISTTGARIFVKLPVAMRKIPAVTFSASADFAVTKADGTDEAVITMGTTSIHAEAVVLSATVAANLVAGNATRLKDDGTALAKVIYDAEL